jgi:hypothetical protein
MWARIENGVVMERIDYDPKLHPLGQWVECGEEVQDGWTYKRGKFAAPVVVPETPAPEIPDEFRGLALDLAVIEEIKAGKKTLEAAIAERGPLEEPVPAEA